MKKTFESNNELKFSAFTKEKIEEQFKEIIETLENTLDHKELMKKFHRILENRVLPIINFDSDSPEFTIYRITPIYKGFDPNNYQCYSYNPKPSENGRAHIIGHPIFYGALDPITAISEMKGSLDNGESFYLSRWKVTFNENTNIHSLLINSNTIKEEHFLNKTISPFHNKLKKMVKNIPLKFQEGYILAIEKMGNLFSNPNKNLYHITSSYAHDILYESKVKGIKNMNIIAYPSVENERFGVNWAIHPSFVNSNDMILKDVFLLKLKKNNINDEVSSVNFEIHKKGEFSGNSIKKWLKPNNRLLEILFKEIKVRTHNGEVLDDKKVYKLNINNTKHTIKELVEYSINRDEIEENLHKLAINDKNSSPLDIELEEITSNLLMKIKDGNEIYTKSGLSCIELIIVPIKWIGEYIDN